jgi:hypothetical protein
VSGDGRVVTLCGAKYRAVLLDFYGTLVEEDTEVIARIVQREPRPPRGERSSRARRRSRAIVKRAGYTRKRRPK